MFDRIIHFSIKNKLIILAGIVIWILWGLRSLFSIPIDAVPDITNNQIQIVTVSPALSPQEVDKFITTPVELELSNIQGLEEVRSLSKFGLSIVTLIFEEGFPIQTARQWVGEKLQSGINVNPEFGTPEMLPITTGLGEIYQYVLKVDPEYKSKYSLEELRSIQDWVAKKQLSGIEGIVEISSFGGKVKEYEIAVEPELLDQYHLTLDEIGDALEKNNANTGSAYIETNATAFYIRSEGLVSSIQAIENIPIKNIDGVPILIKDVAKVKIGSAARFGAMTMDGNGEVVGGITLMFKGENASQVIARVHEKVKRLQESLPKGVKIEPFLDRSHFVGRVISTVEKNLLEGGIIVIFVLILMLGNWRSGLIVASVIPLAMLFAFAMMNLFGISANLMSLGAIDFGLVVDGAIIIVEFSLHQLQNQQKKRLTQHEMDDLIFKSASKIRNSAAFGEIIILIVYFPILYLSGIEGKMFKPMAQTVSFAILGALILSMTYIPAVSALFLNKKIQKKTTVSDKFIHFLQKHYANFLEKVLKKAILIPVLAAIVFVISIFVINNQGAEFIPTLEEGDLAMQMTVPTGTSLSQSIKSAGMAEKILKEKFPEVKHVISKIGTAEVPTDPMSIEDADVMIILKDKSEWTSAKTREELAEKMKDALKVVPGANFEFTQPIQLRFNELISGSKNDIAIKIFGENMNILYQKAEQAEKIIKKIPGAADVRLDRTDGLNQYIIEFKKDQLSYYGVSIEKINFLLKTAFAGSAHGNIYENERRFDLVLRLDEQYRHNIANFTKLKVRTENHGLIPLSELVEVKLTQGPVQISKEHASKFVSIGVNVRNRDVQSLISEIDAKLIQKVKLPSGYYIEYGGEFENLQNALNSLQVAVPIALLLILFLLYFSLKSVKDSLLVFTAIPLSAIGGIFALWFRGMPFSISAGVGFIALFGVAVLNTLVMMSHIKSLVKESHEDIRLVIIQGAKDRLRPIIMTALVASLGFLPMALSTSAGAEVQQPLATVVIGGLISSTLLSLFVLPSIYYLTKKNE